MKLPTAPHANMDFMNRIWKRKKYANLTTQAEEDNNNDPLVPSAGGRTIELVPSAGGGRTIELTVEDLNVAETDREANDDVDVIDWDCHIVADNNFQCACQQGRAQGAGYSCRRVPLCTCYSKADRKLNKKKKRKLKRVSVNI